MNHRMRSGVRILIATTAVCLLTTVLSLGHARAETEPFARPATLEPQISFWVDVFTAYSYRDFVLVDRDDPNKLYQVFHLPGDGCPSRDEIDWANNYLKS